MANNRDIPTLSELAYRVTLFSDCAGNYHDEMKDEVFMQAKILHESQTLLQYIGNAEQNKAKALLVNNPKLAVLAKGTVTTPSGYTYENISAIELAYVLDDIHMYKMMSFYLNLLPIPLQELAHSQLVKKAKEVAEEQTTFKPYDFGPIANILKQKEYDECVKQPDSQLINEFGEAAKKFKMDFTPTTIKKGRSHIRQQLKEALLILQNIKGAKDSLAFRIIWSIVIIGTIEKSVEECDAQAFSQGLIGILKEGRLFERSVKIKIPYRDYTLHTYRRSYHKDLYTGEDHPLLLGEHYYVDFIEGKFYNALSAEFCAKANTFLQEYYNAKDTEWQHIINNQDTLKIKNTA